MVGRLARLQLREKGGSGPERLNLEFELKQDPTFRQISGLKSGFKSLSQLLEAVVKTRFVHQLLDIHEQASLQAVF